MILKKKYPQFSYLIKIEDPEVIRKSSTRKYSTISSLGQVNQKRNSIIDGIFIYIYIYLIIFLSNYVKKFLLTLFY